ncbi:MAG: hypothetical protein A3H96_07185 [Acidobacteria bacterium RIFCSPLOWO2_02_FULL_67_36]|nr:MAG: hypothetical protein A3H96_07185 [Acidobacteria bacterium RIFCSPLOWO2_02_FULL_67_36]OFW26492.1 MAG: hypothetical protein A3G21_24140 [Acidobacteria bacterium RIFCSPLOWO2_12_FULL_66_21]
MKRFALAVAAAFVCSLAAGPAFAQTKPKSSKPAAPAKTAQVPVAKAAPTTQAPAAPAKFTRPIKGTASIQFVQGQSKRVGDDIVTVFKIKNVSSGSIALLKIDEYWYDKKNQVVTGDSQPYRKPFNPGDIIEITMRSPYKAEAWTSNWMFSHANGSIDPKKVKKFD